MLTKSGSITFFGVAALSLAASGLAGAAQKSADVPFATPPGITFVDVVTGGDVLIWRRLGDANGDALYTYDLEGNSGRSSCFDQCAKEFPPLIAPKHQVASGDWSLVSRPEGKQWAYRGQPLYRYSGKRSARPDVVNNGRRGATIGFDPGKKPFSPKAGWRQAVYDPSKSVATPADIRLESLEYGNGYGFVVANTGMTIYELNRAPKVPADWTPLYAPDLGVPVGDFSIVTRQDGTRQWTYKGQQLFTYGGDYSPTDINGLAAQKDAQVALAYRFFMPASLAIKIFPARPPLMTTSKGMAVYTEAPYHLQYGGHVTRGGYHVSYDEAKALGTRGCVNDCTKSWIPVAAPADAQSWGFWEVATGADGSKQWAYKGAALYTYIFDKTPGATNGNSQNTPVYGDPNGKNVSLVVLAGGADDGSGNADPDAFGAKSGAGFYWHIVQLFPYN